ncbi:MAG: DUF5615 family PIN-like protein [Gammaproteobacteria bacterium]
MKLLLDACIWSGARIDLAGAGHDVEHAGDWREDPGDSEILFRANRDKRILVTLDKDFGELAIVRGHAHAGIIRLVGVAARQQGRAIAAVLARCTDDLASGAIVTAEPTRIRVRLAPAPEDSDTS